jgi:hypothetical protein
VILAKQACQDLSWLRIGKCAELCSGHCAAPFEPHGVGQSVGSVAETTEKPKRCSVGDQQRIIDPVDSSEFSDFIYMIDADPYYFMTVYCYLLLRSNEQRDLGLPGR